MAKILTVDDDEHLTRLIASTFKSKGHEVVLYNSGKEAMTFLENESNAKSLNLLIVDRMLGDLDGVEIVKFFREKYGTTTPILILSGLSTEKDLLHGLGGGATDYLTKPFSIEVLMQKAGRHIGC